MASIEIKEIQEEEVIEYSKISQLIRYGLEKSYVTIQDILKVFPDAENDMDKLEEAFAALAGAGILFVEDSDNENQPTDVELDEEVKDQFLNSSDPDEDDLKNISSDDTVGLYLK